jgi:hypothetical protein
MKGDIQTTTSIYRLTFAGSSTFYGEALALSESLVDADKGMSTSQRVRTRVGRLERAAMASNVFATIQYSRVRSFFVQSLCDPCLKHTHRETSLVPLKGSCGLYGFGIAQLTH